MSVESVARELVDLCNQGRNFDAMRTLYAPGIVSVERYGEETAGQAEVIAKSERWAAANTIHAQVVKGPYFSGPDGDAGQFAVHFSHEVTPNGGGARTTLEEVGLYTVRNDRITREQFFYTGSR